MNLTVIEQLEHWRLQDPASRDYIISSPIALASNFQICINEYRDAKALDTTYAYAGIGKTIEDAWKEVSEFLSKREGK